MNVTSLSIYSYTCTVSTILSITSTFDRSKVFSTYSSHLTTVILFYGSGFPHYLMPTSGSSLELIFSVQYRVVTPIMNPLIYSLKNKEIKAAVRRTTYMFSLAGKIKRMTDNWYRNIGQKILGEWTFIRTS